MIAKYLMLQTQLLLHSNVSLRFNHIEYCQLKNGFSGRVFDLHKIDVIEVKKNRFFSILRFRLELEIYLV